MIQPWQLDVKCPLCGLSLRLLRLTRHGNRQHPDMSPADYEQLVLEAARTGTLEVNSRRAVPAGKMTTATAVVRRKLLRGNPAFPLSGGAFGLGKRR